MMRSIRFSIAVLGLTIFFLTGLSPQKKSDKPDTIEAILVNVIDGDTIVVKYRSRKTHLRLIGIDTPERMPNDKAQRDANRTRKDVKTINQLGEGSANFTKGLLKSGDLLKLEFDAERRDKYERLLAYVYLPSGEMLNEKIILAGYAQPMTIPPNVRYAKKFLDAYERARAQRRGHWGSGIFK